MKQYKFLADDTRNNLTMLLVIHPGDIIEVDEKEGTVKNINTGADGAIKPELVTGNPDKGIASLLERLEFDALFEEVKQVPNKVIKKEIK